MNYIPIAKAASTLKVTEEELIGLGADGELDIYVIPSPAWKLVAAGMQKIAFDNGDEGGVLLEGELTGLAATLLRLKVAPLILDAYRHHPNDTQAEGFVYTDPRTGTFLTLQPIMDLPVYLRDCRLVVRETDLPKSRKKTAPPKISAVESEESSVEAPLVEAIPPQQTASLPKTISPNQRLLRMADLIQMTGLSKSSIYDRIRRGEFPAKEEPRGGRAVFWRRDLVEQWIDGTWKPSQD